MKKIQILTIILLLGVVSVAGCTFTSSEPNEEEYLENAMTNVGRAANITIEYAEDVEDFFEQELSPEEFSSNIESYQSELQNITQDMENLTPPSRFEEFHELSLNGFRNINQSFKVMLEFLDDPSEELLESSFENFETGVEALNQAGENIEELLE